MDKINPFEIAIKAYLDKKASEDTLFAITYTKPNKSISECCKYIFQEARKQAVGNCAALADDVVFGMAVHYYDEDDIVVEKKEIQSKVVVTPKPVEKPKPQNFQLSLFDL